MPFFIAAHPKQIKKRKNRNGRTHCINRVLFEGRACCISFWSGTGRHSATAGMTCAASLTVEAAAVLPLMIMVIWIMIFPLRVTECERRLQNRLEATAGALAVSAYVKETGPSFLKTDGEAPALLEQYNGITAGTFAEAVLQALPETWMMEGLHFGPRTAILSDEKGEDPAMIRAELVYTLRLPVVPLRILPVQKSLIVSRRAWIGSGGGRGRSIYGSANGSAEEDLIVYVGKSSIRYHLDPHCHYLSNRMETADASRIGELRNNSGARYHACPSCSPGKSGTVWYFASGTAYHSTPDCRAITAYARAVPLREAVHLGPCSYCGK